MNNAQKRIVQLGCYVFATLFFIFGLANENAFLAVVVPIALVFLALYVKKSGTETITVSPNIALSYLDLIIDDIPRNFARGLYKNSGDVFDNVSQAELEGFILEKIDYTHIKPKLVAYLNLTFTQSEIAQLAKFNLSNAGIKFREKHYDTSQFFEDAFKNELVRLAELIETHLDDDGLIKKLRH